MSSLSSISFSSETKKFIKDFFIVLSNNISSFFSGILVTLALPKILSMEDYSDYKLFLLYLSYIGFFHFGLLDGIIVKFAGKSESEIGFSRYRFYTRLLLVMESMVAIIIAVGVSIRFTSEYRFLGQVIAIDVVFHNLVSYFRSVMQITMKYKQYTVTGIYGNVFQIFSIGGLYLLKSIGDISANTYIVIYILGEMSQLIICLLLSKNIVFGKISGNKETLQTVSGMFKVGFPLLAAGIVGTLIFNLDRQFVSILFSKEEYAIYSFSYSLMNIILTLIAAMSIVLYPTMKGKEKSVLAGYYDKFSLMLSIFVFGCFMFIPALNIFIQWFLPNYTSSLRILKAIFPIVSSLSLMQIIIINFYKVIENTRVYLFISIIALGISFTLNCVGYYMFRNMESIAVATVLSCFVWQYISDKILRKDIHSKGTAIIYNIIMNVIYYFSFYMVWDVNKVLGICSYIIMYGMCSIVIWKIMQEEEKKQ